MNHDNEHARHVAAAKAKLAAVVPPGIRVGDKVLVLASAGTSAPSWLHLLAEALTWKTVLGVPATVVLTQLGKNASDDIYKLLKSGAAKQLCDLAWAIWEIRRDGPCAVCAVLPTHGIMGTTVHVHATSANDVAAQLSRFVLAAPEIERIVLEQNSVSPIPGEVRGHVDAAGLITLGWLQPTPNRYRQARVSVSVTTDGAVSVNVEVEP